MAQRRVLFFGLDGYDPAVGNALIAEGRLPAMAPMRRTGGHTGGPGMLLVVGPGIEPGDRGL
ncbi:MAG TPA: hypothetical protein VJL84_02250, partial [Kiloniellales bacterium]|nr:hypothetical protein [Kiloniellales bacterium]